MGELKRQDLIYKKEDLLISGLDKYREYNLYQMTGMAISAVFFFLGAYFTSTLKIIIYAGTIMMLFVFVVMLLNLSNAVQ